MNTLKLIARRFVPDTVLHKVKSAYREVRQRLNPPTLRPPYPRKAIIDIANVCNLRCPLCPTGVKQLNLHQGIMSTEIFKQSVEKLPFLDFITLANWGEPLLNENVGEMVRFAKSRGKCVTIHTNLSLKKDQKFFDNLVESGLDRLELSIDGASQEAYETYRRGGNFNLVLENMEKIADARKRIRRTGSVVTWKFIVHRYNEHEIEKAKSLAIRFGFEFSLSKIGLGDQLPDCDYFSDYENLKKEWLPLEQKYIKDKHKQGNDARSNPPCLLLFEGSFVINIDGSLFPCCLTTDQKNAFGNLLLEDFQDIWYNDKYLSARSIFVNGKHDDRMVKTVCHVCPKARNYIFRTRKY